MQNREIRLASSVGGQLDMTPANAQDNVVRGQRSSNTEESIHLTLGSEDPASGDVSVVALWSTDSTFKTPSNSITFSSEELMDQDELSSNNCLARIGQDEVEHYYSDPVGPLYMAPINTPRMSRVNNIVRGEIIATQEQVMALNTQVYPMPSHAAYVVHLKRNIVSIFKSEELSFLVASATRAYRLSDFNRIFVEGKGMPYLKSEMHFMKCETKKTRHLRLPFGKGHAHVENCSYINSVFPCHSSDDKGGNRCRNNGRRPPHSSISEIGVLSCPSPTWIH
ncbi:hypothetical protein AXX17_ATUG00100 [Arabidopsis thaliana]|uniref:Uncharacterized protein n=1 Tax=Arabidopsis thaliana TaxID=3702 RepID=A0A178U696_ARATH|nr:hypothetical protein AXX17_ATUG00100 [Arabidopsis thaliana]